MNLVSGLGVALDPSRVGVGPQPRWCRSRQGVQRRTQRLDRAAQAVEGPYGSEHVGAVGALSTAGDQQLVLPAQRQKRVEQQRASAPPVTSRVRNSLSTEASKPGSAISR